MTDIKRQTSQTLTFKDADELFRLKETTQDRIRELDAERCKCDRLLDEIQRELLTKCNHKWEQDSPM